MKVGDRVKRKWKPQLGNGVIIHQLGDIFVVKWNGHERPVVEFEEEKHLKVIHEDG